MITYKDILTMSYTTADDQSNTFTPYHVRYKVTIRRQYTNHKIEIDYQCNEKVKPTLDDVLYCILQDAISYEQYKDDIDGFADELCDDMPISEILKCFVACKNEFKQLHAMFNDREYGAIVDHFEYY